MNRLRILLQNIKRGVVTEKYPLEPIRVPESFRGKPFIDVDKCVGCGACVNACPPNALTLEEDLKEGIRYIKLFVGRCIYCGRCEEVCPFDAIHLTKEFELATTSKDDLYQIVGLRMYKCPICGKPYTTIRLVKKVIDKLPPEERSLVLICPDCREKITAANRSFARR